jgi:hypothetical protein
MIYKNLEGTELEGIPEVIIDRMLECRVERGNKADKEPQSPFEQQVGGNHYKDYKIQPIEFIIANNIGFIEGNVIKYVCRHKDKNGKEDILKAIHYLRLLLNSQYPENTSKK